MMKNIGKLLVVIFVILGIVYVRRDVMNPDFVRAFGVLSVDLGVPSGDPIFTVQNMLPGDCEDRIVKIKNDGDETVPVAVHSTNETDLDFLSRLMSLAISENSHGVVYSNKLEQFFIDSDDLDGVGLLPLPPGEMMTYHFNICFDEAAGNEYQNTEVIFDLIFGETISPIELPAECTELAGKIQFTIEGTEGDDELKGTSANELIIAKGGDDEVDAKGGDDCVIGGTGEDDLDGGTGKDIIVGGEGKDDLHGGSNSDTLYGDGGNDEIDGESGDDTIYGGPGNDEIKGKAGEDYLDGGADTDDLNGGSGTDTCVNGETIDNCELP